MESRYLEIVAEVDAEFRRNRAIHGDKIHCRTGCTDCCHHLFRITEIEAAWISKGVQQLEPVARESLRARAREHLEARQKVVAPPGESEASQGRLPPPGTRLACPALDEGACSLYEFRPLICRKFGMPIYNPDRPGQLFACQLNFKDGEEIEDSRLIQIQTGIHEAWRRLQSSYDHAGGYRDTSPITVARAILEDIPALPTAD